MKKISSYQTEAARLGITFNGLQEQVNEPPVPMFTDTAEGGTHSTFILSEGQNLEERLKIHREDWRKGGAEMGTKKKGIVDLYVERKAQKAIRLKDVIPLDMEDIHKAIIKDYQTEGLASFETVSKAIKDLVEERMYARLSSTQWELIRQLVRQTLADPRLIDQITSSGELTT